MLSGRGPPPPQGPCDSYPHLTVEETQPPEAKGHHRANGKTWWSGSLGSLGSDPGCLSALLQWGDALASVHLQRCW